MAALAHIGERGQQTLRDHLVGVSRRCGNLAAKLNLGTAGSLIGLLHDLGKYSGIFQTYIASFSTESDVEPQDELRGKIDHSTAGAQIVMQHAMAKRPQETEVARILALCIASHHSGLIDCLHPEGTDGLTERLEKADAKTHAIEAWAAVDEEVANEAQRLLNNTELWLELRTKVSQVLHDPRPQWKDAGDRSLQLGVLVRMLFSCLIDADRTDTADFENPLGARHRQAGVYESWETLIARLDAKLRDFPSGNAIDNIRQRISGECLEASSREKGVFTLTVPTGGGKTLAALRFAMAHARTHGMDRIVFVGPYISIVDQNAAVVREILEPAGTDFASVVLEHHSNLSSEANADHWRRKVLAENWDAPIVFTTMVQVLEALFGSGTRSVRRLHALANSVIIFDEIQTLPVPLVHLFNNAINLLVAHCSSAVLLCTATMPLLHKVPKQLGAVCLSEPSELISDVAGTFRELGRYIVFDETGRPGGWSRELAAQLVCSEASAHGSCLLVVNTKRDALEIYRQCRSLLGSEARLIHLSTGMCPAHRTEALRQLRAWLADPDSAPVVCVSTQLIEAGVDIDFACVVRDLAGLDSIAQAAGRCNRHGRRREGGRVHIIKLGELPKNLQDIRQGQSASETVLGMWRRSHPGEPFPLDDPEQMTSYFEHYFFRRQTEMSYSVLKPVRSTLVSLLGANKQTVHEMRMEGNPVQRQLLHQSFATAASCFAIMGETMGIVVPFREEGKKIVEDLSAAFDLGAEWQLQRRAQLYTISVFKHALDQLCDRGAVYRLKTETGPGVFCLRSEFYDSEIGLTLEAGPMEELFA